MYDSKRFGIFGGTFNPPHLGHVKVAYEVMDNFGLNKIFVMPAAIPPHKRGINIVRASHRLEMTRLAFEKHNGFIVSNVEINRNGPSYTIDTVNHFKKILPRGSDIFLILGIDAFIEITTWKSHLDLLNLVPMIIMTRPWNNKQHNGEDIKQIVESYLLENISREYMVSIKGDSFIHPNYKEIYPLRVSKIHISSTRIREYIKQNRSIQNLVPETVENYIRTKGLYL